MLTLIYFSKQFDNNGSLLQVLKDNKIVKQGGSWYTLDFDGDEIKFQSKDWDVSY